jgi:hypothetical protein
MKKGPQNTGGHFTAKAFKRIAKAVASPLRQPLRLLAGQLGDCGKPGADFAVKITASKPFGRHSLGGPRA